MKYIHIDSDIGMEVPITLEDVIKHGSMMAYENDITIFVNKRPSLEVTSFSDFSKVKVVG